MKIYIDTNIWLAYYNSQLFKGDKYNKIKEVINLISILKEKNLNVIFSYFNLIELSARLRDTLINLRLLKEGYGIFELSKAKKAKSNKLNKEEEQEFDKALSKITSLKFIKNLATEESEEFDKDLMEKIYLLAGYYGIDMPDAFHVILAIKYKCDLFISNDRSLLNKFKSAQKKEIFFRKIKVLLPHESIKTIDK